MSMEIIAGKESVHLKYIYQNLKYRIEFARENPDYFYPDGVLVFVGSQGTGKTLSAVNYVYKLMAMYPKSKLITNLFIRDYPIVTFEEWLPKNMDLYPWEVNEEGEFEYDKKQAYEAYLKHNKVFMFMNNDDFTKYENGMLGVIYLVDEIQLYLNSLESKNVNMETVTELSQQRKQRKHIICTSQVFGRMAKPLREQFSSIVQCKKYFNMLQVNKLINRDSLEADNSSDTTLTGKVEKKFVWFHQPYEFYGRYDTYYKVQKGKFVSGENKKGDIYGIDYNIKLSSNN